MNLRRIIHGAFPALCGTLLFAVNQAPVFLAYLNPPPGYTGSLLPMDMDALQYRTWIDAYRDGKGWLLPDYHAPWSTEPALMNPICWFIGRTSALLGIDGLWIYYVLCLALTVAGVYALLFAIRAFTESRTQARVALVLFICCVPIPAVLALVTYLCGTANPWLGLIATGATVLGRYDSDSFLNGISSGPLVLFGTVATILCMALLAKYLKTNSPHYLRWAALVAGLSAFIHPFEIFVIMGGGGLALLLRPGQPWRRSLRDIATIVGSGLLGLAPYVYLASRHAWLKQAAVENHWQTLSPPVILMLLGFPALFCLLSYPLPLEKKSVTDTLLDCWFCVVFVEIYVPFLPWQHHLLDGVYYAIGLILARHAARWAAARNLVTTRPAVAWAPLLALLIASLAARAIYWKAAVEAASTPGNDASALVSNADRAVLSWLHTHASADDLLLAPKFDAGYFASLPMHSFGSHWLFSLSWGVQVLQSDAFYKGSLEGTTAHSLLSRFGVRYVLIPGGSPAGRYFADRRPAVTFENAAIFEMPNAGMHPYVGLTH